MSIFCVFIFCSFFVHNVHIPPRFIPLNSPENLFVLPKYLQKMDVPKDVHRLFT